MAPSPGMSNNLTNGDVTIMIPDVQGLFNTIFNDNKIVAEPATTHHNDSHTLTAQEASSTNAANLQ